MSFNSYGNRMQRQATIVQYLIIANVVCFIAQLIFKSYNITSIGSLHYYTSPSFQWHQVITNFFMHDPTNYFHIIFNMVCLFTFGSMLERVWGPKRFLIFYLLCGIGASLIMMFTIPFTADQFAKSAEALQYGGNTPEVKDAYINAYSALGASGAVMGLEAAFVYLFPNTQLYVMFIPVPVKAKYVIPFFMLIDLFGGFYRVEGDNIGHFAHLGGALIGFIIVLIWNKRNKTTFY